MPELNPYIPDDFSLIKSEKKYDHPELIVDESNLRVVYAPSRYFSSEPKADVSLILRNPKAMDSARNQVMFALNDYLAGLALDQLSNQASVGGISFSTNANNGLMVNANGYTQRLPQLFQALLEGYFSYTATEDQLEQAKSWYNQMMDSAEKGKAFEQAIMPAQMLSQVPYFSRDERRKILPSITLKEVLAYRDALKSGARPEFMVIGNMTEAQATTLARDVQNSWALMVQNGVVTKMSWSIKNNPSSLKKPVTAPTPHWQRYLYRLATMNTPAQPIALCWGRSYSRGSTISCVPKNSWAMPCLHSQ